MTRKLIGLMLALILCLSMSICAFAADTADFVSDDAGLLSGDELDDLNEKLEEISDTYGAQVAVATVDSLEEDPTDYVQWLYDEYGYGYGADHDGVLLLICMDPRECRILSNGLAAGAITEYDIELILDAVVPYLSDGDYAEAFYTFADECTYYLNGYINGYPFDAGSVLFISLVGGLIVGLIVALRLKGQLKSVRRKVHADMYVRAGSMNLTRREDYFLYRNITRREKPKNNTSSSSGGSSRNVGGRSF